MIKFLKSLSRTFHEAHDDTHVKEEEEWEVEEIEGVGRSMLLTVWRKSLCVGCNGFTVIDTHGNLVYRVDNYSGHRRNDDIILMDASGIPILTLSHNKEKLGLTDNWLVYGGEGGGLCSTSSSTQRKKEPIFCAKKNMNMVQPINVNRLARVIFSNPYNENSTMHVIEGSYAHRSCKVLDGSRRVVAEIKKKEASTKGISFGLDVFVLIVRPGFNPTFAMAIVLLLDQMFS